MIDAHSIHGALTDADEQVYRLLEGLIETPNQRQLHRAITIGEAARSLFDTAPGAAMWLVTNPNSDDLPEDVPPDLLISHLRVNMRKHGLYDDYWQQFTQLDPKMVTIIAGTENLHAKQKAVILNAIIGYRLKDIQEEQISAVSTLLNGITRNAIKANRNNAERATALALHFGDCREIRDNPVVADYVNAATREGAYVEATTWDELLGTAQDWYVDEVHRQIESLVIKGIKANKGKIESWNSLLPPGIYRHHELGSEFTVTPLTNVIMLYAEGKDLHHCVGERGDACRTGRSRVFSIRGNNGERATLEIQHERGGGWLVHRLCGPPDSGGPSEMMENVAERVASDYEEAWDQTPVDERSVLDRSVSIPVDGAHLTRGGKDI